MERNLRIITGLVLYLFIATHLINVALGVVSPELIEAARPVLMGFWSFSPVAMLLLLTMIVHAVLGLKVLYGRNTLQMSASDTWQFASGFLVPPLLIPHVWGIIAMAEILDTQPTYAILLQFFWIDNPLEGLRQVLLIVVVWIHGTIGIFTWLRLKSWWTRVAPLVYPLIVLVPVLALLGFVEGGNLALKNYEQQALEQAATYGDGQVDATDEPSEEEVAEANRRSQQFAEDYAFVQSVKWNLIYGYLVILGGVLIARHIRLARKTGELTIRYEDGTEIHANVGNTILELAQHNAVPHASLCRGRGRCGTCRVRIINTTSQLPEPSELEASALAYTQSDPDMRLACQCVPGPGVLEIERLLQPDISHDELKSHMRAVKASAQGPKPSTPLAPEAG